MLPDVDERRRRAHGVRALLAARAARVDRVVRDREHALEDSAQIAHVEDVVEPALRRLLIFARVASMASGGSFRRI